MKERGNTTKSLLIAVAILVAIGFGGYMYINRGTTTSSPDLLVMNSGTPTGPEADFLKVLQQLEKIKLDVSFFKDSVFTSLTDSSTKLMGQDKYRQNPFAPIDSAVPIIKPVTSSSTLPAVKTKSGSNTNFSVFQ